MSRHISEQYDLELSQISEQVMTMGGLVEQQVDDACNALIGHDPSLARRVKATEQQLNSMEVSLDDQCIGIIARRQPAASDLRDVICMMKSVADLERIGDEANRIASMALALAAVEMPASQYATFRSMHQTVLEILGNALDAFARKDAAMVREILLADREVDTAYNNLVEECTKQTDQEGGSMMHALNLIWAARALERVGDHAKNIAEYVVYRVRGQDIRHSTVDQQTTDFGPNIGKDRTGPGDRAGTSDT